MPYVCSVYVLCSSGKRHDHIIPELRVLPLDRLKTFFSDFIVDFKHVLDSQEVKIHLL